MGYVVLDLYPRPGKFTSECHTLLLPGKKKGDTSTPTLSVLLANFLTDNENSPALLEYEEVISLFHEFGHTIHALYSKTLSERLSGTQLERDFIEIPAQMFERLIQEPEILKMVSSHVDSNEPLPDHLIHALCQSDNFLGALSIQTHLFRARYLLALYKEPTEALTLKRQLFSEHVFASSFNENCYFECQFPHFTYYGATYYSYLWSLVYALDLFQNLKENGLTNKVIFQRIAHEILEKGGSEAPDAILENFLGRKPSIKAFEEYIAQSLP